MAEPQLLGDRVLPESLRQRRQSLRTRIQDLREPIRQRRENLSPVNIIGMVESNVQDLRNRVVSREGVLGRIQARREDSNTGTSNSGSSGGSSSSSSGGSSGSTGSNTPSLRGNDEVDSVM